jgi:transcriptional regulator with XRE-family HTH domain
MRRQRLLRPADLDLLARRRLLHEAEVLADLIEHGPGWRAAANSLRTLRLMLGLSIPALARRSGVGPRRLLRAESRPSAMPRWTLARVLLGLGVPAGTFLKLSELFQAIQGFCAGEASPHLALPGRYSQNLPPAGESAECQAGQPADPSASPTRHATERLAGRRTGWSTRRRPSQPPGNHHLWLPGPKPEQDTWTSPTRGGSPMPDSRQSISPPPPSQPWTIAHGQAMLDAAADRIVGAIEVLDVVREQLPRPDDFDERQKHRLPCDQATDVLATIECVLAGNLHPAVEALRRSARITDAELEQEFHEMAARRQDKSRAVWPESEAIRETTLLHVDDADDREALRRVGRLLNDMALEVSNRPQDEPFTHAQVRAAAADLRFVHGYLIAVSRESQDSTLPREEAILANFAGQVAGQVEAIAKALEERLS